MRLNRRAALRFTAALALAGAAAAGMTFRTLEQTVRDTLEWQKGRPVTGQTMKSGLKPEREVELMKLLHNA